MDFRKAEVEFLREQIAEVKADVWYASYSIKAILKCDKERWVPLLLDLAKSLDEALGVDE